jgi:hypothetical protein
VYVLKSDSPNLVIEGIYTTATIFCQAVFNALKPFEYKESIYTEPANLFEFSVSVSFHLLFEPYAHIEKEQFATNNAKQEAGQS